MKAEIIAIGSELLIGDVINSNAAWISRELASLGMDVYYHLTVGDNPARIQGVLEESAKRSDLLIFTGGLGPTEDDLTVVTIADYFKTPLEVDEESAETIRNYFIARDMPMSPSNLKQAKKPQGAITIKNPVGTAPGIGWDVSKHTGKPTLILAFPGVPKELYAMWPQGAELIQQWRTQSGESSTVLVTRYLHFFGIGESKLGEVLSDLMQASNPTVAPYVGEAAVKIRVAAKAESREQANALIEPVKAEIVQRVERYYYGEEDATLESAVAQLLTESGRTLAVAESCTGGLISSRLTDISGSSAYTFINMITYGNEEKSRFIGVSPETLAAKGAVSPEVAVEMALGIRETSGCNLGLSVTGIAGPEGGSDEKPVGLAYIGICGLPENESVIVKKVLVNPKYARRDIKHWFSQYALHFLHQALRGELQGDYPELCGLVV